MVNTTLFDKKEGSKANTLLVWVHPPPHHLTSRGRGLGLTAPWDRVGANVSSSGPPVDGRSSEEGSESLSSHGFATITRSSPATLSHCSDDQSQTVLLAMKHHMAPLRQHSQQSWPGRGQQHKWEEKARVLGPKGLELKSGQGQG
ncbi:hypothetical protein SRHO_G00296860 [Serrasalmus rhombeus]